jgi:BirA family biotin operon repressor/biotin-[acetyl-CoA-carboxylase] ligase
MARIDAVRIRSHLTDDVAGWLRNLEVFDTIDSTNTYLVRKGGQQSIDGHAAFAEHQSAGRGRRGRDWKTPRERSIALSLGIQIDVPPARLGALSLVAGVAVAAALEGAGIADVGLKWPNDIVLGGAKLGGILIEVVPLARPSVVVVGVGINVTRGDPELAALADPVAAVSDVALVEREALAAALIVQLRRHARRFEVEEFAAIRPQWERRNVHRDAEVTVHTGDARVAGRMAGIGESGELVLATGEGERRFTYGEVSLRGAT